MQGHSHIHMRYHFDRNEIEATIGTQTELIPFTGRIDEIRDNNLQDTLTNISVHEAGHAVVYMLLFGLAPLQLKSKVASSYAGGFTFPHQIHDTECNLLNKVKIYLAGGLAEELIFGKPYASIGRGHDREQATALTIDYIRKYGFAPQYQANYVLEYGYAMDKFETDPDVERLMAQLAEETTQLLKAHQPLLQALARHLSASGNLTATEVARIAQVYQVPALVKEEGHLQIPPYADLLSKLEQGDSTQTQ